jgi:hypothetical protein
MEYPNQGTLWHNKYKNTPNKPDMTGDIKIELELFKELLANAVSDHVVIKLSAWLGKHTDGNRKITLKFDNYKAATPVASTAKDPWDD